MTALLCSLFFLLTKLLVSFFRYIYIYIFSSSHHTQFMTGVNFKLLCLLFQIYIFHSFYTKSPCCWWNLHGPWLHDSSVIVFFTWIFTLITLKQWIFSLSPFSQNFLVFKFCPPPLFFLLVLYFKYHLWRKKKIALNNYMNSKNHEIKSCDLCIEKLTSEEEFINHKLCIYVSVHMDI